MDSETTEPKYPGCWLYCEDAPDGVIFTSEAEVEEALAEGWVDSAKKVGQEPAVDSDSTSEPIAELGGGYYQVTHGEATEKVRGRPAAEAKLAEFQAASA